MKHIVPGENHSEAMDSAWRPGEKANVANLEREIKTSRAIDPGPLPDLSHVKSSGEWTVRRSQPGK